jgi:CheY-like chemotaxis protein
MYTRHDLILQVRQHLLDLLANANDEAWSSQVIRCSSSHCGSETTRWAIEIEEPDARPSSTPTREARVLLVSTVRDLEPLYSMYLTQAGCKVDSVLESDAEMKLFYNDDPYDVVLLTDIGCVRLIKLIREKNPKQPIALVGTCGATACRFHYKIPILRIPFRKQALVRIVESAIKPEAKILLVAHENCGDLWHLVCNHPMSFEVELESDGGNALQRYRERRPYDMVLTGFHIGGMDGADLASALLNEDPAQRIVMVTEEPSSVLMRSVQSKLGNIPILREQDLFKAMRKLDKAGRLPEGEAQSLIDSVHAAIAEKCNKGAKQRKRKVERNRVVQK